MQWAQKQKGFTIVELLIVVVVIAILAAITIIAYNGIQNRARTSAVQSELSSAAKALENERYKNAGEQYPAALADANITLSDATYIYDPSDNSYCLTKTANGNPFYISNVQKTPNAGTCGSDGMVGQWTFNGNANDSIGSNNGTVTNATLTTGQNGQANGAYSFNGTNATINLGNNAVFSQRNITMSIWARPSSVSSVHILLAKEAQYKYRISSGYINQLVRTSGGSWTNNTISSTLVPLVNTWSHIVMTVDSEKAVAKTYVNGVPVVSTAIAAEGITSFNGNEMYVGSTNGAAEWFNGALDDARVYNRVLGAAEIKGLYNAGAR